MAAHGCKEAPDFGERIEVRACSLLSEGQQAGWRNLCSRIIHEPISSKTADCGKSAGVGFGRQTRFFRGKLESQFGGDSYGSLLAHKSDELAHPGLGTLELESEATP
jgi:hypothetical protein